MVITKKLDIDKDIEFLESGTMCHASNVVVNMTNDGILSENGIEKIIELTFDEKIVGHIDCSTEFIIFTSNDRIIRINSKDYTKTVVRTNWKWQGGKVIGCYTYNANQELIVSISEQIDYNETKVPLKIINLDKPNYQAGDSDDKYTLAPEIPMSNLLGYEFISGNSIYKGTYVFFIRYKLGTDYTSWFKIGYPINVYNREYTETVFEGKYRYHRVTLSGDDYRTEKGVISTYGFSESCDDAAVNVNKNIKLNIEINLQSINYDKYQIGYIVTDTENGTHVFTTVDYNIDNKVVIIDNKNNNEISADELTRDAFQIYNAKTLCNYGNRVYLANYNEENLNTEVENINVDSIEVSAVKYFNDPLVANVIEPETTYTTKSVSTLSNSKYQWKEDKEPSDFDWNLQEVYNIEYAHGNNAGAEYKLNQIYGLKPIAVGYRNFEQKGETILVDKDFAIAVPLFDIYRQTVIQIANKYDEVNVYGTSIDDLLKQTTFDKLYVLFIKNETVIDGDKEFINGIVVCLKDDSSIEDDVPVFDKLYDFNIKSSISNLNYPCVVRNYIQVLPAALYYMTRFTVGDIGLDDNNIDYEYRKTAINNAVYNFFIHFVYPNGNYTAGIRIPNNRSYKLTIPVATANVKDPDTNQTNNKQFTYDCTENTTIGTIKSAFNSWVKINKATNIVYDKTYNINTFFNVQDTLRICNIYPVFDDTGIAIYINSKGEKLFRGYPRELDKSTVIKSNESIKFVFDNIPKVDGFIGYFISYEKPEHILIGSGVVTPYRAIDEHNTTFVEEDFNGEYDNNPFRLRFYYPEFSVIKKASGINTIITLDKPIGGRAILGPTLTNFYDINADSYLNTESYGTISGIKTSEIVSPNDASNENGGREGILRIILNQGIPVKSFIEKDLESTNTYGTAYLTQAIGLAITDNLYLNKNKELISLGMIKYYNDKITNNTYGYDDYPYNYDYYKSSGSVYAYDKRGIVFNEVEAVPKYFDDNEDIYPNKSVIQISFDGKISRNGVYPICRYKYNLYCEVDLNYKQIDNPPIEKYYTLKNPEDQSENNNEDIVNVRTVYIYPLYINDLFKSPSCYDTFIDKLVVNYNDELFYNFITYYGKTIRRSDVISDESIENRWRIFRAEEYKIIKENKGNIINIVGIGVYLMAHCEHSLFIFNRDNTMRTNDKDVQLLIPDAFEIDYSEVFTSDKGYAGLQEFNQWCISNYGYIFFDKDSKKIYRFDNTNLTDITPGMMNLFKFVDDVKFAIDNTNERLLCIGSINKENDSNKFTISYSFLAKDWISSHTYWYEDLFNTKDKTFFILNDYNGTIHTFTDKFNEYSNIIDNNSNIFKTEFIAENNIASFVDVVFNNLGIDKVLDYISYRINKSTDDNYSGDKLLIYTNNCYSDYIDISKSRKNVADYKNPVFRYGIWVFNWFKNKVLNINSINPIIRGTGKFALTNDDLGTKVDNKLIVGKWFVIRLIFADKDKRININDIQTY